MPSRFTPITPGADPSQQVSIINKNFAELDTEGTIKLFSDKTGTPNISIGLQPDGTSRIRVAKPGFDVTKATDADLSFNSAQNTLKIVASGVIDINISFPLVAGPYNGLDEGSGGGLGYTLGYTPTALLYYTYDDGSTGTSYRPLSDGSIFFSTSGSNYSALYKFYFTLDNNGFFLGMRRYSWAAAGVNIAAYSSVFKFKYFLLQESIN